MAAEVRLDPEKDLQWVIDPKVKPLDLPAEGKMMPSSGSRPSPRNCATVMPVTSFSTRRWIGRGPYISAACSVATSSTSKGTRSRRGGVVRAILKATDLCAHEPARVAQNIADRGLTGHYDYQRQALTDLPYYKWREYDAEDTIRFYPLRLYEVGLIKSSPNKILAEHTDWRFFNELRRELKA